MLCLQGKAQRRINAVHVLDVLVLNGTDVREQHFNQRPVFIFIFSSDLHSWANKCVACVMMTSLVERIQVK